MSRVLKGIAFEISDLRAIREWAEDNGVEMRIRLDYGLDDEDYEEVIAIHRSAQTCLMVIWRDHNAIFVQPLPGRLIRFASVHEALQKLVVSAAKAARRKTTIARPRQGDA